VNPTVTVDQDGVTLSGAGTVTWAELDAVLIRTTDRGPFEEDVLLELHRSNGSVPTVERLLRTSGIPVSRTVWSG
jgi:hypothetical protein